LGLFVGVKIAQIDFVIRWRYLNLRNMEYPVAIDDGHGKICKRLHQNESLKAFSQANLQFFLLFTH